MFRCPTEAVASTLTIGNHGAVANAIGTGAATPGGTGHARMAKRIVFSLGVGSFSFFSHCYRLPFSLLTAFQIIGADGFKAYVEFLGQLGLFRHG